MFNFLSIQRNENKYFGRKFFLKVRKNAPKDSFYSFVTGVCFEIGFGTSMNNQKAISFYKKSAKLDNSDAF
jgi:TPR repeat protein